MKKALSIAFACSVALSLVACGGGNRPAEAPTTAAAEDTITAAAADTTAADTATASETGAEVADKDKPLVWFNCQPSNSATGQLGMTVLDFDKNTYYIGSNANQGTELQGIMVENYIEKNIDSADHNGDGIVGYVLAIDDIRHNDSIARTRGVRKVLGTAVEKNGSINNSPVGTSADGTATVVQDGSTEAGERTHIVRELASQEVKNSTDTTWDTATAGNAIDTWSSFSGDQIDAAVSNNDGMGMFMFNAWSKDNKVPAFGYDANSDTVIAITEGHGGAISQHADVQTHLTFCVPHNVLGGVDIDTGIGTADDAGNVLSSDIYVYKADERSYYALDVAVTAENYTDFTDSTVVYIPVFSQLGKASHATKSIWLNIYNPADSFLGSTYQPLLQKYDKPLNLRAGYIDGDRQTESSITSHLGNPSQCDTFTIDMVEANNTTSYTFLLEQ